MSLYTVQCEGCGMVVKVFTQAPDYCRDCGGTFGISSLDIAEELEKNPPKENTR